MSASYRIIDGSAIPLQYLKNAYFLDEENFTGEDSVPVEHCLSWHEANKEIYTVAVDNETDEVLSCMNMLPVTPGYYEKIRNGEIKDSEIPVEGVVRFDKMGSFDLYFSAIAIKPGINKSAVLRSMIDTLGDKLIKLSAKGIMCRRMIADAVSDKGKRLCEMYGMKNIGKSPDGSLIYEVSMLPPEFRPVTKKHRELYTIYKSFAEAILMEKMIKGRMKYE